MARGGNSAPAATLDADEWLKIRQSLGPEMDAEVRSLLRRHNTSTWEGFNNFVAEVGVLVLRMKIHPVVAASAIKYLELGLHSLMIANDKYKPPEGDKTLVVMLQEAESRAKEIRASAMPRGLIESDDDA